MARKSDELIPLPSVVRARLAAAVREARLLRSLLRLSIRAYTNREVRTDAEAEAIFAEADR